MLRAEGPAKPIVLGLASGLVDFLPALDTGHDANVE